MSDWRLSIDTFINRLVSYELAIHLRVLVFATFCGRHHNLQHVRARLIFNWNKAVSLCFLTTMNLSLWFNVWWKHSQCVINQTIDGVKFRNWCYVCKIFKTYKKEEKKHQIGLKRRSLSDEIFVHSVCLHHYSPSQGNCRIIKKFMTKKITLLNRLKENRG